MEKIGQGHYADAFLGLDKDGKDVVILIKGNWCERIDNIYEIFKKQKDGILDTKYMIKIIDVIECQYPYSDDQKWCPGFKNTNPIQILEYASVSLKDYIKKQRIKGKSDNDIKQKIENDLIKAYQHIYENGYDYSDISSDNLIYDKKTDRIKFIDLETLQKTNIKFSDTDWIKREAHRLVEYV